MRLVVHDAYVQAFGNIDEMNALHKISRVKNPRASFGAGRVNTKVPEYIDFVDEEGRFLRGLMPWIHDELVKVGVPTNYDVVTDDFQSRDFVKCPPDILPGLTPRDYQIMGAEQAYNYRRGIVQAATGAGKTAIIALLNKMIEVFEDGSTLTMVNKRHLLHQTVAAFKKYGLTNIGMVGDGIFRPDRHTVAMVQSLWSALRRGDETFLGGVTAINWDETHHLGATTWGGIAYNVPSKWSIGYSGTPFREGYANTVDPADMQMQGITGSVLVKITASHLIDRGLLARPYIFMVPVLPEHCEQARTVEQQEEADRGSDSWVAVERNWISDNPYRNQLIARGANAFVRIGVPPLVLVRQIEHGKALMRLMVESFGLSPIFLSGGPKRHVYDSTCEDSIRTEVSDDPDADVKEYLDGKYNVLIGSTIFDEGVDLPAVAAVINGAGGKSFVSNLQRVGRGLRPKAGDNRAFILDFIDLGHRWTERHSSDRMADYASEPAFQIYQGYRPSRDFFGFDW